MASHNESNVIGYQAELKVMAALPREWMSEIVKRDIGRDLMIEVIENGEPTPLIVCSQVKGQAKVPVVKGAFVTQRITARQLRYLVEKTVPSVLFVVDESTGQIWWAMPQIDQSLLDHLRRARTPKSKLMVRLPLSQTYNQENFTKFRAHLDAAAQRAAVDTIRDGDLASFFSALDAEKDLKKTTLTLQDRADAARMENAYRLIQGGHTREAAKEFGIVFGNPGSQAHSRITAYLYEHGLRLNHALQDNLKDRDVGADELRRALELDFEMKEQPKPYRVFARTNRRIVELSVLASSRLSFSMQISMGQGQFIKVAPEKLAVALAEAAKDITRQVRRVTRMITVSWDHGRAFIPVLCQKALIALAPLWYSACIEEDAASKRSIAELVDNLIGLGTDVAKNHKNWADLVGVATASTFFIEDTEDLWEVAADRAAKLLEGIEDAELRANEIARIRTHLNGMRAARLEDGGYDVEAHSALIRNLAYNQGIDVDTGTDEVCDSIRLGIMDLSPERVMKNCSQLYVSMLFPDPVGHVVKCPTMGVKELRCTQHGHVGGGESLDDAYTAFVERFCATCSDCAPRPADFKWSPDWHEKEARRLRTDGNLDVGSYYF
ncbi:MAG: DUF4365 domain-containing protein [Planctomycetota bacterium]